MRDHASLYLPCKPCYTVPSLPLSVYCVTKAIVCYLHDVMLAILTQQLSHILLIVTILLQQMSNSDEFLPGITSSSEQTSPTKSASNINNTNSSSSNNSSNAIAGASGSSSSLSTDTQIRNRAKATASELVRINSSLSALGNCVAALGEVCFSLDASAIIICNHHKQSS